MNPDDLIHAQNLLCERAIKHQRILIFSREKRIYFLLLPYGNYVALKPVAVEYENPVYGISFNVDQKKIRNGTFAITQFYSHKNILYVLATVRIKLSD